MKYFGIAGCLVLLQGIFLSTKASLIKGISSRMAYMTGQF
jgi:hypothetical protein